MAELGSPQGHDHLLVAAAHREQMIEIARNAAPLEACGLLAGDGENSRQVVEITNMLASPTRYAMSPAELVRSFWDLESAGVSVMAFFHSHPASAPHPSPTDLEQHYYPNIPQIILGKVSGRWELRAFYLQAPHVQEIPLQYY